MVTLKISSSLVKFFDGKPSIQGEWNSLVDFIQSLSDEQKNQLAASDSKLKPFIKIRINGQILSNTQIATTAINETDDITLFTVASGG